jgi:hypothetical protein
MNTPRQRKNPEKRNQQAVKRKFDRKKGRDKTIDFIIQPNYNYGSTERRG